MRPHRVIIEVGSGVIRRFCCGTAKIVDAQTARAALDAIDDPVTLVGGRPVAVHALWRDALRSLGCAVAEGPDTTAVVHPSWWSASRIAVIAAAAHGLGGNVTVRPRSWLLTQACDAPDSPVVVEIAERLVAVVGDDVAAVARPMSPYSAEKAAQEVVELTRTAATVVIDAPASITGARDLAAAIAGAVRALGATVVHIDDARLPRLARLAESAMPAPAPRDGPSEPKSVGGPVRAGARKAAWAAVAGVMVAASVPLVSTTDKGDIRPAATAPTSFLVEGRVALTVPADWRAQRVIVGPGSARVQVTSPSDPEVALHVTQSVVPGETLPGTAQRMKRAIDSEPPGVFVDFNPSATSAGRPAVTYREIRVPHHVAWTVLLDGAIRISLGCQSRPGGEVAIRQACDQAIRSAHGTN